MSNDTLMCMTEPSPSRDMRNNEVTYSDLSNGSKISKSELADKVQTYCSTQNCLTQDSVLKGTAQKHLSRKREATNVLMECVKRRDNVRTRDFEVNVPSPSLFSNQPIPLRSADYCDFSLAFVENAVSSAVTTETLNSDSSDSASVTDSGIDASSKSSSPCHSIDTTMSSQDDAGEECPMVNMDIDNFDPLPQEISSFPDCPNVGQSPSAIYDDLNSLHLTDEAVLSQNNAVVKSPVSKSLFKHVASTIYFFLKDEKVARMPDHTLAFMKWKLSNITPVLIRELVQRSGFSLLDVNTNEEWLGSWGKHLKCAAFKKIKLFQKVNHYPGSFHLGRKDKLWGNYKRMQSRFGTEAFNFFPETFHLPHDFNSLKSVWGANEEMCWIIKPPAAARGTGVKVIHKWSQVPKNRPVIVQRYLSDPYLINGTKFDLRIYVLITSVEPLRVYVFEDGLVRFASEKYSLSNKSFSNRFVHLTNYSINKKSSSYTSNEDENSCQGHKWTLKAFWAYMANSGIDVEKIQKQITDVIIKTLLCTEIHLCRLLKTYAKTTYNCYELFGYDIMLDKNLRPWLLEVNISPSLHISSLLDSNVKGQMVKDMFNMAGFQVPEGRFPFSNSNQRDYGMLSPVGSRHKAFQNRGLSNAEREKHSVYTFQYEKFGILDNLTPDDVRCLIETEDEYQRKGAFTRIFPSVMSSKYLMYFEHVRYYNLLLDAWEKTYHDKREEGIRLLQELCDKKVHLQTQADEPPPMVEQDVEMNIH